MKSGALCFLALAAVLFAGLAAVPAAQPPPDFTRILDRYAGGDHDNAVGVAAKAAEQSAGDRAPAAPSARATRGSRATLATRRRRPRSSRPTPSKLLRATLDTEWRTFESLIERHCDAFRRSPDLRARRADVVSRRPWRWPARPAPDARARRRISRTPKRFLGRSRFQSRARAAFAFDMDSAPGSHGGTPSIDSPRS